MFRKVGKVVIVNSYGVPTNPITTTETAGSVTVAGKFKPAGATIAYITATNGTTMQVNLGTSGTFTYGYASSQITSANIRSTFAYIAAE